MKNIIKKIANRETLLYLIFGILSTLLNIILFYLFVTQWKILTFWGNLLDTVICILFQYFTNRMWVFQSENKGKAAIKEFFQFLFARSFTAIIDQIFVVVGVDFLVVKFIIQTQQSRWNLGIKILSNIIVVVLNYIFSKLFVFNKKNNF